MPELTITGPVGRRWRQANVRNAAADQATIIRLLASIPAGDGGQLEAWAIPPAAGPDGACPPELAEAIWAFQVHWRDRGVFKVIDGVVDPGMNTLAKLNALAAKRQRPSPPHPRALVARTHEGGAHAHLSCPLVKSLHPLDATTGPGGRITHVATPLNPQRFGRMICVGGAREVAYLGFEDVVPDPKKDSNMPAYWVHGRRLTTSLPDSSVSDICFRSTGIDHWMRTVEMPRICAVGCRLTYAAHEWAKFVHYLPYFRSLGPIVHHEIIYRNSVDGPGASASFGQAWHVAVVHMVRHKRP